MKASEKAIEVIKEHEGLRLKAYTDHVGVVTIGYGHTKTAREGMEIDQAQAEVLLKQDISGAERIVSWYVGRVSQNQFDALVSFVFNVGSGKFKGSTLLKKVKADPNDPTIADEFKRWVRGGGKVLPGLVKRRTKEAELYFS